MIYRLEIPYYHREPGDPQGSIDTLDIYLEGREESPSGEQFVDTLEMLAEKSAKPEHILDAIRVIKNLGAPDEGDHGWQEYFPYLCNPDITTLPAVYTAKVNHPDQPIFADLNVTLTWIKVFKPYLRSLRDLVDDLRFVKDEDKQQIARQIEEGLI